MAMTLDGTSGITQMTGSIVMSGSTSGTTTIIPSAVAGTTTVTMPAATGTMMVSGNMPAFSAYGNSSYSITRDVDTKVRFNNERFDTNNCFDSTTNYRFTPNVTGYYQVNAVCRFTVASGMSIAYLMLYKNGSLYSVINQVMGMGSGALYWDLPGSDLVYMNGTTDYLEVYINVGGTTVNVNDSSGTQFVSLFSASMIRST